MKQAFAVLAGILSATGMLHGQTAPASAGSAPASPPPATATPAPVPAAAKPAARPFVPTLTIGQPAPVLGINVWIKGAPVNEFQQGRVYVVEFWSPRAPASRRSGPVLSEIAGVFRDKGVTVVSIATVEQEGPGVIEAYVKQLGDKLAHSIGYDTTGDTTRRYMQPSGQSGIPVAYVVNERGQIAWIGHPLDNLERVLTRVLEGSWDILKASDEQRRRVAAESASAPLVGRLEEQFADNEVDKALATMDALFAIDPPVTGEWALTKFAYLLMQRRDADKAYAYAAAMLEGGLKDDAETLKALAWMIVAEPGVPRRDVALARRIAQRADELTRHADANVLDTLAKTQSDSGDINGAVETQKLAVEAAILPSQKKELTQRLTQYVSARKNDAPKKKP